MIASAHFAAGIVIGLSSNRLIRGRFTRVVVAFGAAVVMHLLMDAVPHSDYHQFHWRLTPYLIVGEAILVAVVAGILLRHRLTSHWPECITAGLLGSVLPDAKFVAPFFLSAHNANLVKYYGNRLHAPFHSSANAALGMTTQVLCTVLLLAAFAAFPLNRQKPST